MQKIMGDATTVVPDYLRGLAAAHPGVVEYDPVDRIVVRRAPAAPGKVGLVSGGGSGCEPLHAGYVGLGMLDAACPGEVFSSPVPNQIMAATRRADHGAGVLYVVKNFGGEVMNFGLAAEILRREGVRIEKVLVDDDASFPPELAARRRGLGAAVLVEKIAGAAAEEGRPLDDVAALARRVVGRSRTFGVALSSCTHPKTGRRTFDLPHGEYEVGVGIGGDRGHERRPLPPVDEIADVMLKRIIDELELRPGNQVVVLLSGLGATPAIELYGLFAAVRDRLVKQGVEPVRSLVGDYITSLDSQGALLTVLHADEELLELWDRPVHTASLRWGA
ncbi:dihydroxyacetone kinase subunit DhaK [Micromonospora maris]|uniref:Dihydroxyacetone kinase n=1 Tax=Micromonospora maris TaxID=1003110 RepID=A0A9X0HZG0_9ACTN|nr:dihydroxyacetone kinase subunit DhaK [Micromonospora maris]AEB44415.1 dihydroxyacetone kinase subunit DhaK [Micromonospora maris AB-18-032]KUJ43939.1 dihydroxyacetone kinase [Micromonospora maris]